MHARSDVPDGCVPFSAPPGCHVVCKGQQTSVQSTRYTGDAPDHTHTGRSTRRRFVNGNGLSFPGTQSVISHSY
jgi:hypothetical protein